MCIGLILLAFIYSIVFSILWRSEKIEKKVFVAIATSIATLAPFTVIFTTEIDTITRIFALLLFLIVFLLGVFLCWLTSRFFDIAVNKKIEKEGGAEKGHSNISCELPVNKPFLIKQKMIEELPVMVRKLAEFGSMCSSFTQVLIDDFSKSSSSDEKAQCIKTYFNCICLHMSGIIPNSRALIRIQRNGKYTKMVSYVNSSVYAERVSDMNLDNGIIMASFVEGVSVVKSLNMDLHEKGANRSGHYDDYITYALPCSGDYPKFTVNISIPKANNKLLLMQLNFCRFENIFDSFYSNIKSHKELIDFIDKIFDPNDTQYIEYLTQ